MIFLFPETVKDASLDIGTGARIGFNGSDVQPHPECYVYVYAFSRRFYPKRLTNEDITSYIKKLTINYIEGTH